VSAAPTPFTVRKHSRVSMRLDASSDGREVRPTGIQSSPEVAWIRSANSGRVRPERQEGPPRCSRSRSHGFRSSRNDCPIRDEARVRGPGRPAHVETGSASAGRRSRRTGSSSITTVRGERGGPAPRVEHDVNRRPGRPVSATDSGTETRRRSSDDDRRAGRDAEARELRGRDPVAELRVRVPANATIRRRPRPSRPRCGPSGADGSTRGAPRLRPAPRPPLVPLVLEEPREWRARAARPTAMLVANTT